MVYVASPIQAISLTDTPMVTTKQLNVNSSICKKGLLL